MARANRQKTKSDPIARLSGLRQLKNWHGLVPLAVFLVCSIPASLFLVFHVPFMWAPDGGAHTARVFQIAEGGFRPLYIDHNHGVGYGGEIPLNVSQLKDAELNVIGQVPAPPGGETTKKLITKQDKITVASIANQKISKQKILISYVNTAAYSPVAYAPDVVGVWAGMKLNLTLGHTLRLAELLSSLTFLLCAGYALFTLRKSSLKWIVLSVSLLPLVVFQSTVITADAFLISISILLSALILKALSPGLRLTLLDKILLYICIVIIPLVKSVYFPVAFLALLVPKRHWATERRYWLWLSTALVLSMAGFLVWSHLTTDVAASNGLVRGDMDWTYGDATVQKNFVLHHPVGYLHVLVDSILYGSKFYMDTFFGWLGFTYLPIPGVAMIAGYFSLALSTLVAGKLAIRRYVSGAILAIVATTMLIVFTTLYVYYTPPLRTIIEGVQGRYFLPLTVLFLAAFSALLPKLRIDLEGRDTAKVLLVCLAVFCFTLSMWRYGLAIVT
jgi:uncharacterized membrane protein